MDKMSETNEGLDLQKRHRQALPTIRLARNADGQAISELLTSLGWHAEGLIIDWNDIAPFWLVAEQDGVFIGCIQTLLSKPIGRLEFLAVRPDLSHPLQALTVRALVLGGCATLEKFGATAVAGTVPHELKSYKRVLKNRGAVVINTGSVFLKRLR
jgi:hypothetical protein